MKNYKEENVYHLNGVFDGYKVITSKKTDGANIWYESLSNESFGGGALCFETQGEMENFYSDWMDELNSVQG